MAILEIDFAHRLQRFDLAPISPPHGPLFHQWLPNGEDDAISLPVNNPGVELRVWFNRQGYARPFDGVLVYDEDRTEAAPELIANQGGLDAGPVFGRLTVHTITDQEAHSIRNGSLGDPTYVAVGRKVVTIVYDTVSTFINLLRINLGQYWLRKLDPWDSRTMSLGAYCGSWAMTWRIDGIDERVPFVPDAMVSSLTVLAAKPDPADYLSRDDWFLLESVTQNGYKSTLPGEVLTRANALSHQGDQRFALIEATTAAELAIAGYLREKAAGNSFITERTTDFKKMPLKLQLGIICSIIGVDPEHIEQSLKAIDTRNQIVHEGASRTSDGDMRRQVSSLMKTVATLLGGPSFRFPAGRVGYQLGRPPVSR